MKILLTGPSGQVGWELVPRLATLGALVALDRSALDLTDAAEIRARVRDVRPDVIVNAAAYTAVDRAESEPDNSRLREAAGIVMPAWEESRARCLAQVRRGRT